MVWNRKKAKYHFRRCNIQKSDDIKELAVALNKVQAKLKPAIRGATNPFFKSSYADLASIWEACRSLLADNGLSVVQTTSLVGGIDGTGISLDTTLLHSSGQWISGQLFIVPSKNDPQGIGSALTYARRYSLSAIVGIATEDDDGEGTMDRKRVEEPKAKKETKATRLQRLLRSVKSQGYTSEQIKAYIPLKYEVETSKDLTEAQIIELTVLVEAKLPLEVDKK